MSFFASPAPSPAELLGWLRGVGWVEIQRSERWATVQRDVGGRPVVMDVPLLSGARDYARAAGLFLQDLAELEERRPEAVLADVRNACLDVVRLALAGPGLDGGLGLGASVGTMQGARDLLLAAACSTIDPRPAYLGRKPAVAMQFLEQARWARVEHGSVVLCLEVPVPPQLQMPLLPDAAPEREPEMARRVTRSLARGMSALQTTLQECASADSVEPALVAVEDGVSANLCEAAARMVEQARAESLDLLVSFATRRPVPVSFPRRAVLQRADLPLLREVARGLTGRAEELDTTIIGPVVRLESPVPEGGGRVTLHVELDGKHRLVRLEVGGDDYGLAVRAHADFLLVRATGTLRPGPSGFTLAPTSPLRHEPLPDE